MPRIVIDPGHTGVTDPGAVAGGLREADITLDVALKLRDLLAGTPGLELRLTRDRHQDLTQPYSQATDLRARTDMANTWGADFYLSIHVNAATNPTAHGVETYIHHNASAESRRIAPIIHRHLVPLFAADRGVKQANFHVLRETRMPAVLVELGFITNDEDRARLVLPSFRAQLADALAAGLREALQLPQPEPVDAPAPVMQRPVTVMVGEQQLRGYLGSDGRTWAPVRDVAEALGAPVTWDDGKVVINHGRR